MDNNTKTEKGKNWLSEGLVVAGIPFVRAGIGFPAQADAGNPIPASTEKRNKYGSPIKPSGMTKVLSGMTEQSRGVLQYAPTNSRNHACKGMGIYK